jgi:hypothetical protein
MNCGIPLSERQAGQILLSSPSDHEQSDTEEKSRLIEDPARGTPLRVANSEVLDHVHES